VQVRKRGGAGGGSGSQAAGRRHQATRRGGSEGRSGKGINVQVIQQSSISEMIFLVVIPIIAIVLSFPMQCSSLQTWGVRLPNNPYASHWDGGEVKSVRIAIAMGAGRIDRTIAAELPPPTAIDTTL